MTDSEWTAAVRKESRLGRFKQYAEQAGRNSRGIRSWWARHGAWQRDAKEVCDESGVNWDDVRRHLATVHDMHYQGKD